MCNTKQPVENILDDVKGILCDMQWNLVMCLKKAAGGIFSLKRKVGELCGGFFLFPIPLYSLPVPCALSKLQYWTVDSAVVQSS